MNLIQQLYKSFQDSGANKAFCVHGQEISYAEFLNHIGAIRKLLDEKTAGQNKAVAIITFETIETYATFFACWFSGFHFVPLNPKYPVERNMEIVKTTGAEIVISSKEEISKHINPGKIRVAYTNNLKLNKCAPPVKSDERQLLYILTTSGSTGVPKYVPINLKNVESYCNAYIKTFPELSPGSNVLQVHDHTTDASFTSYLLPLLAGACVYTLPDGQFKFLSVARLMSDKNVNWVKLTPSVLAYLNPYIDSFDLQHIQYFAFGGEALPLEMLKKWWAKFPNARLANFYGPTEGTMNSLVYRIENAENIKSLNGIVSLGKPLPGVEIAIIDKNDEIVDAEIEGELCLTGKQVMNGYLNKEAPDPFIVLKNGISEKKYYKTGDLVKMDKDGFIYFIGRTDDQVKIEGFRINLSEVETSVRNLIPDFQPVVVAHEKKPGLNRLYLFLKNYNEDTEPLKEKLTSRLPWQMVPEKIFSLNEFPYTTSGKIDRKKLCIDYLYYK